jgi:hypothetical protein
VIQRKTQTDAYWREQFAVTSQDLGRLYDLLLDAGRPVATSVLARTLIEDHCRREETRIQAELKKGPVYQPQDSYRATGTFAPSGCSLKGRAVSGSLLQSCAASTS